MDNPGKLGLVGWIALLTAPVQLALAQQPAWLAFAPDQNRPAFEVTINGEPTLALIDSGISANAISTELAARAGVQASRRSLQLRDINDGKPVSMSESFVLGIGEADVPIDEAVMMPTGKEIGMVLGRPLLNLFIVQIDYPNQRLRLLPRGAAEFEGNLKMRRGRHHQPMAEARLDGERIWMNFDTANSGYCEINHRAVEKRGWNSRRVDLSQAGEFALRDDHGALQFEKLELGPYTINTLIAAWVPTGQVSEQIRHQHYGAGRAVEKSGADGILGYDVLRNFVVTLNMVEDEVHLFAP